MRAEEGGRNWRDVRVVDADDLVQWLEECPAVAQWPAVLVRCLSGLRGLAEVWGEWCRATRIPLTADVVLAGRDEDAAAIHSWLSGPLSLLKILGCDSAWKEGSDSNSVHAVRLSGMAGEGFVCDACHSRQCRLLVW